MKRFKHLLTGCLLLMATMAFPQSGYVGESIHLNAPSVSGTIGGAAWESSSPEHVMVSGDKYGATARIDAYFSGSVTITCTYVYTYYVGGKLNYSSSQHAYYYIQALPSRVTLDKTEITLRPNQEETLTYTNSSGIDLPFGLWTTSDKNVATVDYSSQAVGLKKVTVLAKKEGECIITFEGNTGREAPSCKIIVRAIPPTAISLTPERLVLQEGKSGKLTYKLIPDEAYADVTWSSSDESIAKVNSGGTVTAVSEGTTKITATTSNGISANATVEVTPQPKAVSFAENKKVALGYSAKLEPVLTPSNASTTYKWETSDVGVVSVDDTGRAKGRKVGKAEIKVTTENGKSGTCSVEVVEAPEGMDYKNVQVRINTLKDMLKKTLR